jgi:uncharacterized lipoprotein YmbA
VSVSRRACLRAGPVVLVAALAGCGSSPPTRYYRLAEVPGAIRNAMPFTVGVRSVSIPGYLDQNGIAKGGDAYQFSVYGNDLWADQLANMLQAVMVEDLAQRLPASTVIGSGGSIGVASDVLVEINVLRFDPDSTGKIALSAQFAIKGGRNRALWLTQSFARDAAPAGVDISDIVATMSMLWAALADQVAESIAAYRAGRPVAFSGAD